MVARPCHATMSCDHVGAVGEDLGNVAPLRCLTRSPSLTLTHATASSHVLLTTHRLRAAQHKRSRLHTGNRSLVLKIPSNARSVRHERCIEKVRVCREDSFARVASRAFEIRLRAPVMRLRGRAGILFLVLGTCRRAIHTTTSPNHL